MACPSRQLNTSLNSVVEKGTHGSQDAVGDWPSAIAGALAPRLGLCQPATEQSDEEIAASALPPHVPVKALKSKGWVKATPAPAAARQLRLSGKQIRAPEMPGSDELRMLTPKAHHFLNSNFANMPRQRKAESRPVVQLHTIDAAARGLAEGDKARIANSRGWVEATLTLSDTFLPWVAALEGKWWSSPEATAAVGNLLTPSSWSSGGQPAYNDTFVKIETAAARY